MTKWKVGALVSAVALVACGGGATQGEPEAPIASAEPEPEPSPELTEVAASPEETAVDEAASDESATAEPVEPEFTQGMSVDEAIAAVPQDADRLNIEQEVLSAPLMNVELYASCKLGANQHFQAKVAVWDGRAVGIDVTTKPKSDQVAQCVREQIEGVTWEDKAKSLNTVEFSY